MIRKIRLWWWRRAVIRIMKRRWGYIPNYNLQEECWTSYFDEGYSPLDTVTEEESCF